MARLTSENTQRARDLIALYPQPRSALIPILHIAQEQDGYLTEEAMTHAGELLGLTSAEVRGTASFYDMLFLEPIGRYLLSVCTNIACLLNGGYELLEHAERELGVRAGGTTADRTFTVEEVECIALCGNAPCMTVNWRYFGDMTPAKFDELVDDLRVGRRAEEVPPHGTLCRVRRSVGLTAGVAPPAPAPTPSPASAPAAATASGQPAATVPTAEPPPAGAPAPVEPQPPAASPHGSEVPGSAPAPAQPATPGTPAPADPPKGTQT